MQTLPTNYAGLALLILGIILLITEAYTPTFGVLTLGGLTCMILGSMLLFESTDPIMRVSTISDRCFFTNNISDYIVSCAFCFAGTPRKSTKRTGRIDRCGG